MGRDSGGMRNTAAAPGARRRLGDGPAHGRLVVRGACLEAPSEETLGGCKGLPGVISPPHFFFLEPGGQGGFQPGTLRWMFASQELDVMLSLVLGCTPRRILLFFF